MALFEVECTLGQETAGVQQFCYKIRYNHNTLGNSISSSSNPITIPIYFLKISIKKKKVRKKVVSVEAQTPTN